MAPTIQPKPQPPQKDEQLFSQSFADSPLEMLVDFYNEWVGRTLIIQADLSPTISLKFSKLTKKEAMQAIETVLAMNGVALVPMGEKFLKVVPIDSARQEGMSIKPFDPEESYVPADQLISQIIPLRYVVFTDVQAVVQHLIHGYGKIQSLERINSILITDTSANIARIVEVLAMLDQPLEQIEPRIYQLNHAKADDIASKLKELVEAAQPSTTKQEVVAAARTIPGVIRAPTTKTVAVPGSSAGDETQMIQGEVKFVSDERTNILIVFSKQANFDFFDRIIKVLDVPVDPEVVVETINLEYAEASEISGILNEFVGAAQADEETKKAQTGDTAESGSSRSLNDVVAQRASAKREISAAAKTAIGRLSEDTKILSDERTNSLLLMGNKGDVEALKSVIARLDVMLQQVMIEAVIISVGLDDSIQSGIQWVYQNQPGYGDVRYKKEIRDVTTYDNNNNPIITPTVFEVPEYVEGKLNRTGFDADDLADNMVGGALTYYGLFPEINLETIISAAKSDSNARVLSTPVVLTTDNTEATITIADERPVITSSINSGSSSVNNGYSARATYEYKTIGIDLTVTPRINPKNFVLMEINQSADDVGGNVTVDGNEVPIIQKREITATVGVKDKETIILGGLVRKSNSESATKIPLLGDIPLLGWLFSSHSKSDDRQELVVLLTPYVLNNPEEAQAETIRRFESSDSKNSEWPRGWSLSELANDEPEKEEWKTGKKAEGGESE
ncbi:type II secretion system secretin GspD [Tichowtungia aerotolerans]|uniref:Type II secretion system secretin GspD n=1 Tax=Tichowtungia aerotolerans TaxID=2697043 RepID=A0A6P1M798_9BACT|nr:type II secretion system secretin GspD [Tichowtungia aerotolerans]QHI70460.1 type II secretion system secretin GspD [Tichowtungia aerotolerans]